MEATSSWRRRVEKGVHGRHHRDRYRRDDRDSHKRRRRYRGTKKGVRLVAFSGVGKGVVARGRGHRCMGLSEDECCDGEDDDEEDLWRWQWSTSCHHSI